MQYEKNKQDYFIYIEKDEKVMHSLTKFCLDNNIQNSKISGIGAVKMTEIGAYDIVRKEYLKKEYSEVFELISFQGNVTLKDNQSFVHAHVVLSNHNMATVGGHLFESTVAAVGEFFLRKFEGSAFRKLNREVGLPCICLQNDFK